ncbi:L-idonate 5-dehydrogenase [Celeribacter marinus]|uniref:L-idonate 5-dehydrogenase n=1 Tax=Celeribacter marinus TaxID=1397108 RepID=UPI003F6D14A2
MKALYAHGPRDLQLGSCDIDDPQAGEVRIKMARGGICGSDLHYFLHGGFGTVRLREPMVLGHEVSGHVTAIGEGVDGLAVGDLVAVSPSRPCGACEECARGNANHCANMRFYGSAMPFPHIQGAFREEIIAMQSQCVKAEGLTPAEAATAEPLAVVLHALHQAGDLLGKRVLVTGCGPIGLLTILAARRAGAADIIATDISDRGLEFARNAGANVTVNTMTHSDGLAVYGAGKGTLDVLFECSGAQVALAGAIPAIRPKGVIVQVGMSGDMTLPMQQITVKELALKGSFRFHPEFATAISLMQQKLIDVTPLITHAFPLEQFQEAFDTATDREKAMKVQLVFG